MWLGIAIGVIIVTLTLSAKASKWFHDQDEAMAEMLADNKRIDELRTEAMQRYPQESEMIALSRYKLDNAHFIQTLKDSAEKADVAYALTVAYRDQRLLSQEIAHLFRIEIHNESHFNVLTSARA